MLSLFLSFEIQKIYRYFKRKTSAKIITILLFAFILLFVSGGVYSFFVSALRYINFSIDADLRLPLNLFLYEVFLLFISLLIILSTLISGVFLLFKGKNDSWIMSSPKSILFPHLILIKSIVSSFWPLLVLFVPLLLAFNHVYSLSFLSVILILFGILFLHTGLSTLTLSGVIGAGYSYLLLSKKEHLPHFTFGRLIMLLSFFSVIILAALWNVVKNVDIVKIFKAENPDAAISVAEIGSHFILLPSHRLAELLISFQQSAYYSAFFSGFCLLLFTVFSFIVWAQVSKFFTTLWKTIQEDGGFRNEKQKNHPSYTFTGNQMIALFKKELLTFSRNKKGVIWLFFLLMLWLGQIGTHSIVAKNIARYTPDITAQQALLESLQFVTALYFIAALTLRFVFPSFSTEKRFLWILGTAPVNTKKVFFGKYFFYIGTLSFLGILMQSINLGVLALPITHSLVTLILFLFSIFFIVTLGICIGALFPSTESDDPEVISTSLPGLSFTLLSLCFASGVSFLLYQMLLNKISFYSSLSFMIMSIVCIGVLLYFTIKRRSRSLY